MPLDKLPSILVDVVVRDGVTGKELSRKGINFPLTPKKHQEFLGHPDLHMSLTRGIILLAGQALGKFMTTDLAELKKAAIQAYEKSQEDKKDVKPTDKA